jgi:hypothetical protein
VPTIKEVADGHILTLLRYPRLLKFGFGAPQAPDTKGARMGLVRKAGGGSKVPAGEKLRFRINRAVEDEGDHGPQVRLDLEVLSGEYRGEELREWCKVAVDEETDEQYVADGGKLYNVALACFEGNAKFLNSLASIDDLAEALVGKSFVSITKPRGKSGDYTGITWDMIYVDQTAAKKAAKQANDEDVDDLAFGDPPPAF